MKVKIFLASILFSTLAFSDAYAITADEALEKFRGRMYSAGSLTGIISWSGDSDVAFTGSFKYMSPGRIYVKFSSPQGKVLACNGKKLWIYDPANNICAVQDMDGGGSYGIAGLVKGYMGIVTSQGSSGYTLKLKKDDAHYPEIILSLDSSFFLKKAVLKDREGRALRFSISNIDTSATVMKTQFDFNVPANTQVIKNPFQIK